MVKLKELFLDLMFPKKCVNCGKWGEFVCAKCWKNIIFKETQECPLCNAISKKGKYCPRCRPKANLTGIISATYYKDMIVKNLLHSFKYEGIFAISPLLATWVSEKVKKENLKIDLITYVPLSRKKLNDRGYNQSELLAKDLAKILNKPVLKTLKKIKETKTQVGLPKKERVKNLKNCFRLERDVELKGKRILLIDDVLTTGSTFNECAVILKEAGVREIWGATVAKE